MVASLDVPKDPQGRVRVDRRLQVVGGSTDGIDAAETSSIATTAAAGVYCLGDIAAVQGLDLPCNAQVRVRGRVGGGRGGVRMRHSFHVGLFFCGWFCCVVFFYCVSAH